MSWLIIMFLYPKKIYMLCNDLVNLQGSRQFIYTLSLPLSFLNMTPLPWLDLSFAFKRQIERNHKQHRKKKNAEISLVTQWLRLCFPMQEVRVQSLVGELRSHILLAKKPKHKTEEILEQIQ